MLGREKIVGIEELDELTSRSQHAGVPRSAHTGVGLPDQLDSIAERCETRSSIVGRTVVNDHDLSLRVALVQTALDEEINKPRPIIDRNNDAHLWSGLVF